MRLNRRRALFVLGTFSAAPALGASAPAEPEHPNRFLHGIASGDPLTDRVILWTRIGGLQRSASVKWQVSRDKAFGDIVSEGNAQATPEHDFTVKVDAGGLQPGTDYYYRFRAGDALSPVGRTRTLAVEADTVVLAVASCALHPNGYFNAYRDIANLSHVDAVVHLGDYIYEYGAGLTDYGMGNGRTLMRIPDPPHEITSLSDYRRRHAQYKTDHDLQAAHARAPWICVFDDHEICNNPWRDGAQNHNPGEGEWSARKAAALKAWHEWMPIRDPGPRQLSETIHRSFRFGQIAELTMLESRLLARSKQLDYGSDLTYTADGTPDAQTFRVKLDDPARELLGAPQRQWLGETLSASVRDGVAWQLLGNQIVMARVHGPDLAKVVGPDTLTTAAAVLPEATRRKVVDMTSLFGGDTPMPLNLDAWDGYPAERERVYALMRDSGARTVVLSGDSHCAWANHLHDATGERIALELGVTAISSPTKVLDNWLPDLKLADILAEQNDEVVAADDSANGYVLLTLTRETVAGEWRMVDTLTSRDFTARTHGRFTSHANDLSWTQA